MTSRKDTFPPPPDTPRAKNPVRINLYTYKCARCGKNAKLCDGFRFRQIGRYRRRICMDCANAPKEK